LKKITHAEARKAATAARDIAESARVEADEAQRAYYNAESLASLVLNAELNNPAAISRLAALGYEAEPEHLMADVLAEMERAGF
jgi:hypothetical protein